MSSRSNPVLPDAAWHQQFRRRLRAWFDRHARDLPWRRRSDPYAIWISEIMLQQTQVATVKPYFERFMEALPSIEALARADEHEVLRLWEGLGYYRRARQLHQAAKLIVAEYGGRFPRDPEAVRRLPGIGRYTAGAVLSIAFDAREPILEANTLRLFSRLLAYRGDPTSTEGGRLLWAMAEAVLPRRGAGRFNQALMELGSEVCTPRVPRCPECPAATLCRANAEGLQAEIPPPKRRPVFEDRHEVAVVVARRGKVLLVRCPQGERWAGLWDFPRFEVQSEEPAALAGEIREKVLGRTGVAVEPGQRLTTFKHGVTRFRITLDCYQARYLSGPNGQHELPESRWLRPDELDEYPLSTTGRKLARWIR
jgi:A/G-specific adenine glycosylase